MSSADLQLPPPGLATSGVPGWLVSWPVIIVGFLLCLLPGVLLLWLRPSSSVKAKAIVTAVVVAVLAVGALTEPTVPADQAATAAADAGSSAAPSSSPNESAPVVTPTLPAAAPPSEAPTPSASLTPSASASPSAANPGNGTALAAVSALMVKGRAPRTGYARDQFGSGWVDVNRNGCDTRNDILARDLHDERMSGRCKVLAGTLDDRYTGSTVRFQYGGASEVDIDHLVALSDAWQKGAAKWPFAKRVGVSNGLCKGDPVDHLKEIDCDRDQGHGDEPGV